MLKWKLHKHNTGPDEQFGYCRSLNSSWKTENIWHNRSPFNHTSLHVPNRKRAEFTGNTTEGEQQWREARCLCTMSWSERRHGRLCFCPSRLRHAPGVLNWDRSAAFSPLVDGCGIAHETRLLHYFRLVWTKNRKLLLKQHVFVILLQFYLTYVCYSHDPMIKDRSLTV